MDKILSGKTLNFGFLQNYEILGKQLTFQGPCGLCLHNRLFCARLCLLCDFHLFAFLFIPVTGRRSHQPMVTLNEDGRRFPKYNKPSSFVYVLLFISYKFVKGFLAITFYYLFFFLAETFMMCVNVFYIVGNEISV